MLCLQRAKWISVLKKKKPDALPYQWGYFTGWMGLLCGFCISILNFSEAAKAQDDVNISLYYSCIGIYCFVTGFIHLFIIFRNRWLWILAIILQLNPVLWVINGIYLKNRWIDLKNKSSKTKLPPPLPNHFKENTNPTKSVNKRIIFFGSIIWIIAVLSFVFLFEPYGNNLSDENWLNTFKITIYGPFIMVVGYFLYIKIMADDEKTNNNSDSNL